MLKNQPSLMPSRKVALGGVWGAVAVALTAVAAYYFPEVNLEEVIYVAIGSLASVVAAYTHREKA